jgi:hypothetical protein
VTALVERHHATPGEWIERTGIRIFVSLVPTERREHGNDVAVARVRLDIDEKSPQSAKFLVGQLCERRAKLGAIDCENAEIERLKRADGNQGEGRAANDSPPLQTAISLMSRSTMSVGSVICCTCSGVTPGAISTSFKPRSVTSSTQ